MVELANSRRDFIHRAGAFTLTAATNPVELISTISSLHSESPSSNPKSADKRPHLQQIVEEDPTSSFDDLLATIPELPEGFFDTLDTFTKVFPDNSAIEITAVIESIDDRFPAERGIDTAFYPDYTDRTTYLGLCIYESEQKAFFFHNQLIPADGDPIFLDDISEKVLDDDEESFNESVEIGLGSLTEAFTKIMSDDAGSLKPTIYDTFHGSKYLNFLNRWFADWIAAQSSSPTEASSENAPLEVNKDGSFSLVRTVLTEVALEAGMQAVIQHNSPSEIDESFFIIESGIYNTENDNPAIGTPKMEALVTRNE